MQLSPFDYCFLTHPFSLIWLMRQTKKAVTLARLLRVGSRHGHNPCWQKNYSIELPPCEKHRETAQSGLLDKKSVHETEMRGW